MTLRSINFTGRKKIRSEDVCITILEDNGRIWFDADMDLKDYGLPEDASVFIEAYRQTYWMRFPWGTVGSKEPPSSRDLHVFDTADGIHFRVKVVDNKERRGLIIAEADRLCPKRKDEGYDQRKSLLPLKESRDLGQEVFRLDFDGSQVFLLINADLVNSKRIAEDPVFASLVYPAVLREILCRILLVDRHFDTEDRDDWRSSWLCFAKKLHEEERLPAEHDEDDIKDWIDRTVYSFCREHEFRSKFNSYYWEEESR